MDIDLNWNDLESHNINVLRYACQQLRIHPRGNLKKDFVYALHCYHINHPGIERQPYPATNYAYTPQPMRYTSMAEHQFQDEFNQAQYKHHKKTPKSAGHHEVRSHKEEKINMASEKKHSKPNKTAYVSRKDNNYSNDESVYSDYDLYSYRSEGSTSESERMSPLLPPKSKGKHSNRKHNNQVSTKKKAFSLITSIILFILILIVAFLLL